MLDRETILKALEALNDFLSEEGVIGEICIFGGATIILAFDGRFATRDVDAVFLPKDSFTKAIREVADKLDLPAAWLNDGVKGFVSENDDYTGDGMPQYPNLRVFRPSAKYLLAMKCLASRVGGFGERGDVADIKRLCLHLGCKAPADVFDIITDYYPASQVPAKTQFLIEEIFSELNP